MRSKEARIIMRHNRILRGWAVAAVLAASALVPVWASGTPRFFALPQGLGAHDVAPLPTTDGLVAFTAQSAGRLGLLNPADGSLTFVELGPGSAPHGVIIGPDGAAWVTDGGRNSIERVDLGARAVREWRLPPRAAGANLNTASFDGAGRLWFTGQGGWYGRLDPADGAMQVWAAPRGAGPYGIATTRDGTIYFASLAGNYLARIDSASGAATVIEPPTPDQGARRVWADSQGRLWVSYWRAGKVGCYDPAATRWREWSLPGSAHAYAVYVDERDQVWLSDWSAKALVRFDPRTERFEVIRPERGVQVRQLAGRRGELWGADGGNDRLVVVPTGN